MNNILLPDQKAVYFIIPKVACTSLKMAIAKQLGMTNVTPHMVHRTEFESIPLKAANKGYNHYFKFGFVRNPWDRLVSCYLNKINADKNYTNQPYNNYVKGVSRAINHLGKFYAGMSFKEFAEEVCKIDDKDCDDHIKSQHCFIYDSKNCDLYINFIGKFENLKEDFEYVCNRIGIKQKLPYEQVSKGRKHYSYYYDNDQELIDLVGKRYEKDITLFGYNFENQLEVKNETD